MRPARRRLRAAGAWGVARWGGGWRGYAAASREEGREAAGAALPSAFRFVSAAYQGRSILDATRELAASVRAALGDRRPPHLITMFATPHPEWGASLADAAQHLRERLTYGGHPRPTLIGGVLRSVAAGCKRAHAGEPGVAVLAAHMPGVALLPFRTASTSLPALGTGAWADIVRIARASGSAAAAAAGEAAAGGAARGAGPRAGAAAVAPQPPQPRAAQGAAGGASGPVAAAPADAAAAGGPGASGQGEEARRSGPGAARERVAALLLSTPHFVAVEELLQRLGAVAPGMQVLGGVTAPGAWGESESNFGALWLDDHVFAEGAVGCVLRGPFQLDTIVSPGFRGAGPVMRVTGAAGQAVLELDGEPVQQPLQRAMAAALSSGEFATKLKIGVGDACGGGTTQHQQPRWRPPGSPPQPAARPASPSATAQTNQLERQQHAQQPEQQQQQQQQALVQAPEQQLVTRSWFVQQGPPRPVLTIFTASPVTVGTLVQVHLQNYPAAHRHMREGVAAYAQRLPPAVAVQQGAVAALALSCAELPFDGAQDVARCLPEAAFAGGAVEGEFCSTVAGQPSRMHSFASSLVLLRAADEVDGAPAAHEGQGAREPSTESRSMVGEVQVQERARREEA